MFKRKTKMQTCLYFMMLEVFLFEIVQCGASVVGKPYGKRSLRKLKHKCI
jgi:hypothetical protein